MVNRYLPHVLVLPEDDAYRQIANGFLLDNSLDLRQIQVLPPTGGWTKVRDAFAKTHVSEMSRNLRRYMVLLVDFDQDGKRRSKMRAVIPKMLADRVFVVGSWSEAEEIRNRKSRTFEDVGKAIAQDCRDTSQNTWGHALLQHNSAEVSRMTPILKPILFPQS